MIRYVVKNRYYSGVYDNLILTQEPGISHPSFNIKVSLRSFGSVVIRVMQVIILGMLIEFLSRFKVTVKVWVAGRYIAGIQLYVLDCRRKKKQIISYQIHEKRDTGTDYWIVKKWERYYYQYQFSIIKTLGSGLLDCKEVELISLSLSVYNYQIQAKDFYHFLWWAGYRLSGTWKIKEIWYPLWGWSWCR